MPKETTSKPQARQFAALSLVFGMGAVSFSLFGVFLMTFHGWVEFPWLGWISWEWVGSGSRSQRGANLSVFVLGLYGVSLGWGVGVWSGVLLLPGASV